MAVDEALARACDAGENGFPVVRFYWWSTPTLSLGAKERLSEAADVDYCRNNGIELVRRATGGRSVLHDEELTYSIVAALGQPPFSTSVEQSYLRIASGLQKGIARLGLDLELVPGERKLRPRTQGEESKRLHMPCFAAPSRNELAWRNRKVVGSAQRRLKNAVLQHGSILLRTNPERLAAASGCGKDQAELLRATMIGINEALGEERTREQLIQSLSGALAEALESNLSTGELSAKEKILVAELVPEIQSRL
jgi:lipoate-protein ligase A